MSRTEPAIPQCTIKPSGTLPINGTLLGPRGLVINPDNMSCILLVGNSITDMRSIDINQFDYVELNGVKFIKERKS